MGAQQARTLQQAVSTDSDNCMIWFRIHIGSSTWRSTKSPIYFELSCPMLQITSGDKQKMEGLKAWLVSKDPKQLAESLQRTGGTLCVHMDGHRASLQQGKHFHL